MAQEQHFSITEFRGLGDPFRFGIDTRATRDMKNVFARYNRIIGRDGYTALGTAQTGEVIGLFDLQQRSAIPVLVRMDSDDIFEWDTGGSAWSSIKGAVTLGQDGADDFARGVMYNDSLYIITNNEQLIKWTGTGNVSQNANSPGASCIEAFEGFLFLGDAQATNVVSAPGNDRLRYESTNVDGTWDTTLTVVLNQTSGPIRNIRVFGRTLFAYKTDAIIGLRFIGGDTVFQVEQVPFTLGILAGNSIGNIPGLGHIFLATDGKLYLNHGQVQQLTHELNNTLVDDLNFDRSQFSQAVVDNLNSTYKLFYPSGSSNYPDKRLDFNYITGEFAIHDYTDAAQLFTRVHYSRYLAPSISALSQDLIVGDEDSKTYTMDDGTTDNTTTISRYWTSDWQDFGFPGEKYLSRIDVTLKEDARSVIEIGVRSDFEREFSQSREYGFSSMKTSGDITISHRIKPVLGKWHDVRVRLRPGNLGSSIELKRVDFFWTPVRTSSQRETPTNIIGS